MRMTSKMRTECILVFPILIKIDLKDEHTFVGDQSISDLWETQRIKVLIHKAMESETNKKHFLIFHILMRILIYKHPFVGNQEIGFPIGFWCHLSRHLGCHRISQIRHLGCHLICHRISQICQREKRFLLGTHFVLNQTVYADFSYFKMSTNQRWTHIWETSFKTSKISILWK